MVRNNYVNGPTETHALYDTRKISQPSIQGGRFTLITYFWDCFQVEHSGDKSNYMYVKLTLTVYSVTSQRDLPTFLQPVGK